MTEMSGGTGTQMSETASAVDNANVVRALVASTVGTVIEWYDYALYGAASGLVISKLFFPSLSPLSGLLASFATFAVGFFIRPLGGVVIAHLGDRFGRKPALIFTIILMGGATVGMGLLPTFGQIGVLAPVLLVVLRLVQGFGAGAELAGAMTLVAEYAPPHRRALFTAIPNGATVIGILLGMVAFLVATTVPDETLLSWAWRIPFLLSGLLFLVAIYIRNRLDETPEYVAAMAHARALHQEGKVPVGELLRNSWREVLFGFLSVSGHNANAYILNAFALSYMTNTLGMSRTDGLTCVIISAICGIAGSPLFGALADRVGAAKVYIGGAVFIFLFSFPMFALLDTKEVVWAALGMSLGYGVGYGCTTGAQGAFLANLFPTRYRFSGMAVSRELNGMLIAGPTPLIATSLVAMADGRPTFVVIYVMACAVLTIISVLAIKHRSVHE